MHLRSLLLGAAALVAIAMPAFAADYVGGAVKSVDIGGKMVLTDGASGMTLYTFDKDVNPNETVCYDQCATNWPPAIAAADAVAEGDFTLVARTDGTQMWAYKTKPLYFWKDDKAPGDTTGDMVGEVWHTAIE